VREVRLSCKGLNTVSPGQINSKNPPGEPGALRLLAPQRGLTSTDENKTILASATAETYALNSSIQFPFGVRLAAHDLVPGWTPANVKLLQPPVWIRNDGWRL
jgi:hypothetical protein